MLRELPDFCMFYTKVCHFDYAKLPKALCKPTAQSLFHLVVIMYILSIIPFWNNVGYWIGIAVAMDYVIMKLPKNQRQFSATACHNDYCRQHF